MGRVDYYNDPNAPSPNSLVVAASAVVIDDGGSILLQRRTDNNLWALPGGGMEFGESIADCVIRETHEETGYDVEALYIVGVYSDPAHVFAYDDGEVRQEFSVCVACRLTGGTLTVSDESTQVEWMAPSDIADADMHPRIRVRVTDYFAGERAKLDLRAGQRMQINTMRFCETQSRGDGSVNVVGCPRDRAGHRVLSAIPLGDVVQPFGKRH